MSVLAAVYARISDDTEGRAAGVTRQMRFESWQPVHGEAVASDGETLVTLETRLREVEEDLAELQATFDAGDMRFGDYQHALSALRTREKGARSALTQELAPRSTLDGLDPVWAWTHGSVERRRYALAVLVDHIKLLPVGRIGPVRVREMMPDMTEIHWRT